MAKTPVHRRRRQFRAVAIVFDFGRRVKVVARRAVTIVANVVVRRVVIIVVIFPKEMPSDSDFRLWNEALLQI
jgi:hypothetical protein